MILRFRFTPLKRSSTALQCLEVAEIVVAAKSNWLVSNVNDLSFLPSQTTTIPRKCERSVSHAQYVFTIPKLLRPIFHVVKNLLACGRIGETTLDILDRFHHPGFSAYEGEGVSAGDSAARERLASCLVHPPFSLARLHYDRDTGLVTYDPRAPALLLHPRCASPPWTPWPR